MLLGDDGEKIAKQCFLSFLTLGTRNIECIIFQSFYVTFFTWPLMKLWVIESNKSTSIDCTVYWNCLVQSKLKII